MPETQILTDAVLMFKTASQGWDEVMRPFMEDLLFNLISVQWFFLGLGYIFRVDPGILLDAMLRFLLGNGFALFMVRSGSHMVESWFNGVKHLAYFLGSPPLDPSAIAAHGWTVTDPIAKSLAAQGFLSFALSPVSWIGFGAMLSILLAFFILAVILVGLLIMSYFLTAACPWFFGWFGLSFTRGITLGYVRLVFGTMNGLFCVMLMVAVISELAARMQVEFNTKFLNPNVTLTWGDYAVPLAVGVILCGLFVWMPYKWTAAMDGILLDWAGGRMLMGWGLGVASGAMRTIRGGNHDGGGAGGGTQGGGGGAPRGGGAPGASGGTQSGGGGPRSGGGQQQPQLGQGYGQPQLPTQQPGISHGGQGQPGRSGNWGRGSGASRTTLQRSEHQSRGE